MSSSILRFLFSAILASATCVAMVTIQVTNSTGFEPDKKYGFSDFSSPQNIGPAINASTIDEHPVPGPNGLSLYFASDRAGGLGGRDIYVSRRHTLSSAWGPGTAVPALNSTGNEVPGSISPDGLELFMNSTRPGGNGGVDIWKATRTDAADDFGWSSPVNLGSTINSNLADQNPNYFEDLHTGLGTLIFASDRVSGAANVKDFFQSTRNSDGSFNAPTVLAELNSSSDEARTAVSPGGHEVFFSSNRFAPTTTNQTIFVSSRKSVDEPWSAPVPVETINVDGNAAQPALSYDGSLLYFVSNRAGGAGSGDIYSAARFKVKKCAVAKYDEN